MEAPVLKHTIISIKRCSECDASNKMIGRRPNESNSRGWMKRIRLLWISGFPSSAVNESSFFFSPQIERVPSCIPSCVVNFYVRFLIVHPFSSPRNNNYMYLNSVCSFDLGISMRKFYICYSFRGLPKWCFFFILSFACKCLFATKKKCVGKRLEITPTEENERKKETGTRNGITEIADRKEGCSYLRSQAPGKKGNVPKWIKVKAQKRTKGSELIWLLTFTHRTCLGSGELLFWILCINFFFQSVDGTDKGAASTIPKKKHAPNMQ